MFGICRFVFFKHSGGLSVCEHGVQIVFVRHGNGIFGCQNHFSIEELGMAGFAKELLPAGAKLRSFA